MKSFNLKKIRLLSLVISVVAILLLCVTSVNALELTYSGGGSSESANSDVGDKKYSLATIENYQPIVAYRFSVVDGNKNTVGKKADVYNNSWIEYYGIYKYENFHGVYGQHNKQEWIGGGTFNNNYTIPNARFNKQYYASSNVGDGKMPQDPAGMRNWLMGNNGANAIAIFDKCGFSKTQIRNDYYLLIEPVIQVMIDNKITAATDVELAVLGGKTYGFNTQGRGATTTYDGTFKFISFRVCNQFANYMRINGSPNLWPNAPYLNTKYKSNGKPNLTTSDSAEYYKVIEHAYAVNIVKATEVVKQVTVTIYPNGSTYKYGGTKYTNKVHKFTLPAGSTITLPAEVSRYSYHNGVWRVYPKDSNDMSRYTTVKPGGTYTVKDNIDIVPYFQAKQFQYDTNGGKAEAVGFKTDGNGLVYKGNSVYKTSFHIYENATYRSDSKGYWQWGGSVKPFQLPANGNVLTSDLATNVAASEKFDMYRPGYRFVGWSVEANDAYSTGGGTGKKTYYENGEVSWGDCAPKDEELVTFHAQWAPINVTYDLNLDSFSNSFPDFPVTRSTLANHGN